MADTTTGTSVAIATPDLEIIEGQITTTSLQIAEHFGKRHTHVLRAIRNLLAELPENARPNFGLSEFTDETGRKLPAYRITRDGFTLLAMGFTGKEAMQWKVAYLTAFNKMEQELLARTTRPANPALDYDRISPAQAQDLKEIVAAIVQAGIQGYGETWSRFQRKFKVNSYLELPATQHMEARQYLIAKLPKGNAVNAAVEQTAPLPSLDPLNAQAMAAASKQANEYFDAARQGQYLQQPTAFPPEVLCGLLAQAMLNQRFMLSFDRCTGRMNIKPVPDDAYVLSWQQFARAVVTNDIDPTNTELADLASACNRRLAKRLAV